MEIQKTTNVLIIANDLAVQSLYEAILGHNNYSFYKSTYTNEIFDLVSSFVPQLVVLHFDNEFYTLIFRFLTKMHQTYIGTQHPSILLVVPKDWVDPLIDDLIDARMTSPVVPNQFRQTVNRLLQNT